jgi:dTDP-4-amino-4,6-dideoxygalactose transaminase
MWKVLDFDSTCLGFPVAGVVTSHVSPRDIPDILCQCRSMNVKLVSWKTDIDPCSIPKESWYTVYSPAVTVSFVKQTAGTPPGDMTHFDKGVKLKRLSPMEARSVQSQLTDLSYISGHCSRFNMDPALTKRQFRSIYSSWIDNIISKAESEYLLVAYDSLNGSDVCGFVSFSVNDGVGKIGLLAVVPTKHRSGIGSQLMRKAEVIMKEQGCLKVHVQTQKSNAGACAFYRSLGFSQAFEEMVLHFWLLLDTVPIKQNVPYFTGLELSSISKLVQSQCIESPGDYTKACQNWLSEQMKCPVLLTGSATSALEQAALLCGIGNDDEVIMPSFTFVSTANSVCLRGAVPVFVDIDKHCQIDISKVEAAITQKTKAVIAVHYGGTCCDIATLRDICNHYGLYLIEDAAHAFLSSFKGKKLGTFGHFGCLSFHVTKNTICGEGGALLINDASMIDRAHIIWEKGTNRFDFINGRVSKYKWIDLGSSYVPNEMSCAFLSAQLEDAYYCCKRRRAITDTYHHFLSHPKVKKKLVGMMERCNDVEGNGHLFWIILQEQDSIHFKEYMQSNGITCYSHYEPLHSSPGGKKYGKQDTSSMERTDIVAHSLVRLPVWTEMNHCEVYRVLSTVLDFFYPADTLINMDFDQVRVFFFDMLKREMH